MRRMRLLAPLTLLLLVGLLGWWLLRGDASHPMVEQSPAARPAVTPEAAPAPASARPTPAQEGAADAGTSPVESVAAPELAMTVDDALATRGAVEGRVLSFSSGLGVPGAELMFSRGGGVATTRTRADGAFTFEPPEPGNYRLAAVSAPGFLPFAPEWGHSPITVTAFAGKRIRGVTLYLTPAIEYLGRVVDPVGKPVAGAEIQVLGTGGEQVLLRAEEHYTSDPSGEFRFHAPDNAVLEARHPRFSPGRAALDFSAQVSHRLTLRLGVPQRDPAPRGIIAGRVVDEQGRGVEGARVVAEREAPPSGGAASFVVPAGATTDGEGRFRFDALDTGRHRVTARHERFAPAQVSGVETRTLDLVLRMSSGGSLAGRVIDAATGRPIASYVVNAWRRAEDRLRLERVAGTAMLDPEGRYELTGLPAERLIVTVSAAGYAESPETEVEVRAAPTPAAVLDFRLSRGARLTGQVVQRGSRAPLAGARVTVEKQRARGGESSATPAHLTTLTDRLGRFSLFGLPAGEISLLAAASGHHGRVFGRIFVPEQGEAPPVVIELSPTRPGEEPRLELAGIGVALEPKGEHLEVRQVLEGGGAAEAGVRPGDLVLAVDGRPVTQLGFEGSLQAIRGPEGTMVTLTLRRGDVAQVLVVSRRLVRR